MAVAAEVEMTVIATAGVRRRVVGAKAAAAVAAAVAAAAEAAAEGVVAVAQTLCC